MIAAGENTCFNEFDPCMFFCPSGTLLGSSVIGIGIHTCAYSFGSTATRENVAGAMEKAVSLTCNMGTSLIFSLKI